MQEENTTQPNIQLDGGTYEVIQNRLSKQKEILQSKLKQLNASRTEVFGSVETKLIANNRINTENNCIARDIVTIGNTSIFGYNVHFGLRTEITLQDVFSAYRYDKDHFVSLSLEIINDATFQLDFTNLYKYYRNTIFSKFAIVGNYLHMVFQLSDSVSDIKTFKWLINENTLTYVDNRSEHEFKFPHQHEFQWQEVSREMHRYGTHPHVSILDKVFVETVGGDLTIKIEDNTEEGKGIFNEEVIHTDQTLDDAQYKFSDLGNLIAIEIKPFQEDARYFLYNHKIQEVQKINSLKNAGILLPDAQGVLFPKGYYLQSGAFKAFENALDNVKFQEKIMAPNGEDFLYIFYQSEQGLYALMSYNIIEQELKTPIICNGFTILSSGELCYFKTEDDQTKHHVIQIWQTPFSKENKIAPEHTDSLLFKIGNKDVVKAMAECQALITLLNKEDSYDGLYDDLAKQSIDILDGYYWIREAETAQLSEPLLEIHNTANAAIDEFEKVVQLRKKAVRITTETQEKATILFGKIKSSSFRSIDDFVSVLAQLRALRGEIIGLHEIRYVDKEFIASLEAEVVEYTKKISQRCVTFLLDDKALIPYHERVSEKQKTLKDIKKVIEAKALEEEVNAIVSDLEMLIDIVSNLQIEDTSHATTIIDNISHIFSNINQLKAEIKNTITSLGSKEASAEFAAQIKLVDQSIINYLDIASTPEKTDELLNKIVIQLEELEGKFADYDDFITAIIDKREEVYNAFETRKLTIVEARNKKATALESAANRILKGVAKKALSFDSSTAINGYFASDLMIVKLRDIIEQLKGLNDIGKAEVIETNLKLAKEDALRKLKDKQDLYEDGENIIKLGSHKFGVNKQLLDLSIVNKEGILYYHLTGTDYYQKVVHETLQETQAYWNQELVSENKQVYRSSYLAYQIFTSNQIELLSQKNDNELLELIKKESDSRYAEGYIKGVHDIDALKILKVLVIKTEDLGLLQYEPKIRAAGQYFWNGITTEIQDALASKIKTTAEVLATFPESTSYQNCIADIAKEVDVFMNTAVVNESFLLKEAALEIASYVFEELRVSKNFSRSQRTEDLYEDFVKFLKQKERYRLIKEKITNIDSLHEKIALAQQWCASYVEVYKSEYIAYTEELVCKLLFDDKGTINVIHTFPDEKIIDLKGNHNTIQEGIFTFNYHEFIKAIAHYTAVEVPAFQAYKKAKHEVVEEQREVLRLNEFKPKVLSSFVRNKLIDQVYLPLFGDNLAKQLGTVGKNKRTDRMGMLLLVSPPGYGKTTLMEYLANRLGLVFMKINGPAIGHEITAVDPMSATNAAAREELKKLNLAFEMGNNVMLYLDDIQHCNPEFLQKFISLADGTRKIEGVYNGKPKTYDFRSKKFCVVMAGNPYTESGEKFQIPDMLSNRADIYNLGDIIGETASLFKLSLIENALTSNPILHQLSSTAFDDVYKFIEMIESGTQEGIEFTGNHSKQEMQEYNAVLKKVLAIRDVVMQVNTTYIKSAAMNDTDRTEPAFKLQGSYRDMNKLVAKVVPVMNDKELQTLLLSHYENESQTLTNAAEANLLKYKELTEILIGEEQERWETIKENFVTNNKLKGIGKNNEMAQVLVQMMQFSEHLVGIQNVLKKGFEK